MIVRSHIRLLAGLWVFVLAFPAIGAEPKAINVRITGLFAAEREADLRELIKQWPEIELTKLDFAHAEAVLRFDPAKLFPGVKPNEILARLDDKVAAMHPSALSASSRLPPSAHDKLKRIEIPVVGLDCKACCLAAYEIVAKIYGVEQATASFKDGRITALIDPKRTDRAKLEDVLRQRGVTLMRP